VILRRDDTERDFYIHDRNRTVSAKTGSTGKLQGPKAGSTDLKLAEIRVEVGAIKITQDNITDTRMNADVCGWVMATVKRN
jgi:hypothetical protein